MIAMFGCQGNGQGSDASAVQVSSVPDSPEHARLPVCVGAVVHVHQRVFQPAGPQLLPVHISQCTTTHDCLSGSVNG